MLDPIQITIIDVTDADDGLAVKCTWQWGALAGELTGLTGDWPESADMARAMATAWILDAVEREHDLATIRTELVDDGWTIEFESEDDPFGGAEARAVVRFMPDNGSGR